MSSSLPRDFIFRLPLLALPEVTPPDKQGYIEFSVNASSLEEAVKRANESLADCEPLDTIYLELGIKRAPVSVAPIRASDCLALAGGKGVAADATRSVSRSLRQRLPLRGRRFRITRLGRVVCAGA